MLSKSIGAAAAAAVSLLADAIELNDDERDDVDEELDGKVVELLRMRGSNRSKLPTLPSLLHIIVDAERNLLFKSSQLLLVISSSAAWGESGIIQRPGRESNT